MPHLAIRAGDAVIVPVADLKRFLDALPAGREVYERLALHKALDVYEALRDAAKDRSCSECGR